MTVACVGGEVNLDIFHIGAAVVDSSDRHECIWVFQIVYHTYLQAVFGLLLPEVKTQFNVADIGVDNGHSIDATFVEEEAVIAAMGIVGVIVNHRFILVGHGHVLMHQCPAVGSTPVLAVVEEVEESKSSV